MPNGKKLELGLRLTVAGFTLAEIRELLQLVREIEMRDPSRRIICMIEGFQDKSRKEAVKIMQEIFPKRVRAS